jgi:hypothetical protein
MRAKRAKGPKEFDIVSLVDIVFLLVIFGLVVAAIEITTGGEGRGDDKETLHLTFRNIRTSPDTPPRLAVIAAWRGDSTMTFFPAIEQIPNMPEDDWENQDAVKEMDNKIQEYGEQRDARAYPIIVEAIDEVPFRVIAVVLKKCSEFGNDMPGLEMALIDQEKGLPQ